MIYKYGCSDVAFNKFGGMALLFWKAIQEAKDNGFEEFDMGRSDPEGSGLIAFKEHWGAAGTQLHYWTYPLEHRVQLSAWQRRLAQQIVPAAPDFALEAVGTLLYRHIE